MKLLELPPELLAACLGLLSASDLASICQTCTTLKDISQVESIWQIKCREDFGIDTIEGWHCSYYELYTKVLFKYGRLLGLWRDETTCYGGLVHVKLECGAVQGTDYFGQRDVREPLLSKPIFEIVLTDDKQPQVTCLKGYGEPHPGTVEFHENGKVTVRCSDTSKHRHAAGRGKEEALFMEECVARGTHPQLCAVKRRQIMEFEHEMKLVPLNIPGPVSGRMLKTGVQAGLFKGMYGGHGTEIVLLFYDDELNQAKALKVTGDPNVPAGEVSIQVDLGRPMLLNREQQQTIAMLREIDTHDLPPDTELDRLQSQPFVIPHEVDLEDNIPIPSSCKLRFHALGTVSPEGYTDPELIRNHLIVFTDQLFGVLWMELYSFNLFSPVREVFTSCT